MITCVCLGISENTVVEAIDNGADTICKLQEKTGIGMCCGICVVRIDTLLNEERRTEHPAYQKIQDAIDRKKNV